ncbi:hypothetical protein NO222_01900 [Gluconacetobacter entanii]|nr:hypothetical protein [Gluconacetobacter entanii]
MLTKSFWVPPFDRKRRRLSKIFGKSFTKNFWLIPAAFSRVRFWWGLRETPSRMGG